MVLSLLAQVSDAALTLIHGLVLLMWARGNMTRLGVLPADLGSQQQPVESGFSGSPHTNWHGS